MSPMPGLPSSLPAPMKVLGALLSVCLGAPSLAFAATKPIGVLVRGAGAGSDKAAGFVAHYMRTLVAQDERYQVADLSDTLGGDSADRAKRAFEVAEEMVQKGRAAYETLDLEPAIDYLNTALNKYERHAGHVTDIKKVAELLMLLGATHILRGEDKTGTKRLAQAVAVDPSIEPDPRIFNPSMREIFQDVTKKLKERPQGTVAITSNPSYAEIYLDGKFVGVTPTAMDKVPEGRHFVRMVREGYKSWGKVIEVVGQVEAADTATLKPSDNFEEYDALVEAAMPSLSNKAVGDKVGEVFHQLGKLLKVDELLLAEVRLDGERVRVLAVLIDVTEATVLRSASRTFSYDSRPETYANEIGDLIKKNFSVGAVASAASTKVDGPSGGNQAYASGGQCAGMACQKFKTVVLAVGAGGGALLGGVGALLDYLAYVDNGDYRATAQTSPKSKDLMSSGKNKALLGDVLVGVGIAMIGASVGMYFLWTPSPTASEVVGQKSSGWSLGAAPTPGGAAVSISTTF
jgi:hypothetical protein